MTGCKEPEVDTASNSTIGSEDISRLTDFQLTTKLFDHLKAQRPVTVSAKPPITDDARAIMAPDFADADQLWKATTPKNALSRWREEQLRMRADHTASSLRSPRPTSLDGLTKSIQDEYTCCL